MGKIISARAYGNNGVIYIAWLLDSAIAECRGFDVRRVNVATGQETSLPAWVPFQGQSNNGWQPGTTATWPVQRMSWKDLTWRDEVNAQNLALDTVVQYRIVPMIGPANGLQAHEDLSAITDPVHLTLNFGDISAAFNNGILSTQWLTHALQQTFSKVKSAKGANGPLTALKAAIAKPGDPIRTKLAGDALAFLRRMLERAQQEGGSVLLALYELTDPELLSLLLQNKDRIRIILSNTSADKNKQWDTENAPARKQLHAAGVQIQDRMFNNAHIGHNKFSLLLDKNGQPIAVQTGSTNWTQNGLCAQSNNAIIVESSDVAAAYYAYWKRLLADKLPSPTPLSAPAKNVQGQALRTADKQPSNLKVDSGRTSVQAWYSPNTTATDKNANSPAPPDLAQLFALMRQAKHAILFLVFLPGMHGAQSIIAQAIQMGNEDPSLLVLGAVSNSMAMPIAQGQTASASTRTFLINSKRKAGRSQPGRKVKSATPAKGQVEPVFKQNGTEIVMASHLQQGDLVGAFEQELLSAGNAIIHDKIVVVDPLSDNPVVACGSHNLGYKASYGNDENLLIIQGNQALAQAYAVHVLDVYDHYRFRAEQQESGGKYFDGFLADNDSWQQDYIAGKRGTDAQYFGRK